ncbi:MAG: hypothetical protein FWG28_03950 [Clostridiales bacterium]|nr:hypothetical protein [Clostridiales bacterium]
MISSRLAGAYGLGLGDSLTLKLGTELFEQHKGLGALAVTQQRYSRPSETVTLEIVGIYADTDGEVARRRNPSWNYSINTIFVPKSLLPVGESSLGEHGFTPAEFSFILDRAWHTAAFLEAAEPLFEELGLSLIFNDKGWLAIEDEYRAAERLSLISIAVFSVAVFIATGFTVYLFIGRKKKEYAILRALGAPKGASARSLLIPLMAVAIVSVLAGSGAAWVYTSLTVAQNAALSLLVESAVNASIPAGPALGCIFGELLLTFLIAQIMLRRIGTASPLALIHGGAYVHAVATDVGEAPGSEGGAVKNAFQDEPPKRSYRGGTARQRGGDMFVPRYVWRHIRRVAGKSALAVLLAALLLCAVGQLASMRLSFNEVFESTVVTARFIEGLPLLAARQIGDSVLAADTYYEAAGTVGSDFTSQIELVFTNDIGRSTLSAEAIRVALAEYRNANPDSGTIDDDVTALSGGRISAFLGNQAHGFTVAGIVSTPSARLDRTLFSPGSRAASSLGAPTEADFAEYVIADNHFIDGFRGYCDEITDKDAMRNAILIIDTSKIENIRNSIRLMNALYPIVLGAALLIGAFLCSLAILQSSKEAALLRALGVAKAKTRTILSLEQVVLSATGLAFGFCVILGYKGAGSAAIARPISLFAALYFAVIIASAAICSILATRRSVLELLQTKE